MPTMLSLFARFAETPFGQKPDRTGNGPQNFRLGSSIIKSEGRKKNHRKMTEPTNQPPIPVTSRGCERLSNE